MEFLCTSRSSNIGILFKDSRFQTCTRQIGRRDKAIVTTADDHDVTRRLARHEDLFRCKFACAAARAPVNQPQAQRDVKQRLPFAPPI